MRLESNFWKKEFGVSVKVIGESLPVVKDSMRKYKGLLKRNEKKKCMAEGVSQSGWRKSKAEEKKKRERERKGGIKGLN